MNRGQSWRPFIVQRALPIAAHCCWRAVWLTRLLARARVSLHSPSFHRRSRLVPPAVHVSEFECFVFFWIGTGICCASSVPKLTSRRSRGTAYLGKRARSSRSHPPAMDTDHDPRCLPLPGGLARWDSGPSDKFLSQIARAKDLHTPNQPNGTEDGGVCHRFGNWHDVVFHHQAVPGHPRSASEYKKAHGK